MKRDKLSGLTKLSRPSLVMIALAVPPFFCGGFARTAYQGGGPLWLNAVADVMAGVTLCCISGFGISITFDKTRKFKKTLGSALLFCISMLGLVIGLLITITRTLTLVSFGL